MRVRRLAMVAVALLPVIGVAATASAADGGGQVWKKVEVTFTANVPESNLLATECQESTPDLCLYIESFPNMTLAGDMVGTVDGGTTVGAAPSGVLALAEVGTFAGSINGCGSGTFVYLSSAVIPANGEVPFVRQLVPGTGTGDLEGISGTITLNADDSLTGVFRCHPH